MEPIAAYLLDIEGTTTPVDFVHKTLFPFAVSRLESFLKTNAGTSELQSEMENLRKEYEEDVAKGNVEEIWSSHGKPVDALVYLNWLIKIDRKSPSLKSIQGRIWEAGYKSGELRATIFPDVPPSLRRWKENGKTVAIFSSGSVLAQKLLFRYSTAGDLTPLIDNYFDTAVGSKRDISSYLAIAKQLNLPPGQVLFVSDIPEELDAAKSAGMEVMLSVRPGNKPVAATAYKTIHDFNSL